MPNPDVSSASTISEKMEYIHSTLHDMLTLFNVEDDMVYRSLVFAAQIRATLPPKPETGRGTPTKISHPTQTITSATSTF